MIINSVCGTGSTGRICSKIAREYSDNGYEVKIAYGRSSFVPKEDEKFAVKIGGGFDLKTHAIKTRLFDKHGLGSVNATKNFLKWADEFDPDVLWLHNVHGYYINYQLLFKWIKTRPDMQVKWTLHDCWAFTGHCSYFSAVGCEKWKTLCRKCPQKKQYPKSSLFDNSKNNYLKKKASFTGVKKMEIITPSYWLSDLVKLSFLKDYPVEVRHNTIDTAVFKPTPSDFRKRLDIENKKIVLGVAGVWDSRKGFSDFIGLSELLDERYVIVLVGLSEKQIKKLPKNVIGIARTNSAKELAEIYSAADVFLNLTYEDNYPTVNLEAQACGTPCITYRTGGSVESVPENNIVEQGDLFAIKDILEKLI